jgi:hypothetical protein
MSIRGNLTFMQPRVEAADFFNHPRPHPHPRKNLIHYSAFSASCVAAFIFEDEDDDENEDDFCHANFLCTTPPKRINLSRFNEFNFLTNYELYVIARRKNRDCLRRRQQTLHRVGYRAGVG